VACTVLLGRESTNKVSTIAALHNNKACFHDDLKNSFFILSSSSFTRFSMRTIFWYSLSNKKPASK